MTVKLTTNPANYKCLKALIALELSGKAKGVIVQERTPEPFSKTQAASVLEITHENRLLKTENEIACYFMNNGELLNDNLKEWLKWENSVLEPALHPIILQAWGGPTATPKSKETACSLFQYLNNSLNDKNYLDGDEISAADVAVWVTLYPLSVNDKIEDHLEGAPHAYDWFKRLKIESSFVGVIHSGTKGDPEVFKGSFCDKSGTALASSTTAMQNSVSDHSSVDAEVEVTLAEIQAALESWTAGRDHLHLPKPRSKPILPISGEKNILITSALPYVNNVPHLGNIIGCVLSADVFARYCRLRNYNTLFICGTDEYGTATETKALEEGVTPQEICDKYHKLHAEIYNWFNISFDYFGRTTTQLQTELAQDIFWKLHKEGHLLEDSMEQLLCTQCSRFLADRFVEGTCPFCGFDDARGDQCDKCGKLINAIELKSPRCKVCKAEPIKKSSNHLFLNLPELEGTLGSWFHETVKTGLWSPSARVIGRSWLKEGLKPRCITRDLKWGTPVPLEGYKEKVFYVWYDAPIGYLSITANYTDRWEEWWKNPQEVQLFQFMAKDNVPFHAVIFPACQLGTSDGYTKVSNLLATEYLNYEDGKFSKSRGVGVFGNDAQDTGIPADIWRFYLLYIRPETQDSYFSWSDLMTKNNSELLNNLGNFVNRSLMFLANSFNGTIPEMSLTKDDQTFIAWANRELQAYTNLLDQAKLRDAIRHILNISRHGNQYIQNQKPWVLVKGGVEERTRAGTVIGLSVNVACILSILLQPYMPTVSQTIQKQLNIDESMNVIPEKMVCYLPQGHQIGKPAPLFQKLDGVQMEAFRKRFAGKQDSRENTPATNATEMKGANAEANKVEVDPKLVAELLLSVSSQAEVVRDLKSKKAIKSEIDREVAKLLELKLQLSNAGGEEPAKVGGGGKGKSKKKSKK